ncbi:hypothetical protein FRX31_015630 [Thalictrum thalictroides]|uniref:Uncharacterized protein n=1 Tax=Thalictrum thalictroides TaxID=46969 RepID=A0A7J6WCS3_THATH|nr:hypothetical protein FRX31_015630 [Thalictrum thalictroides]
MEDFQGITLEEEQLLQEIIIEEEDDKTKEYEQILEENMHLKAENARLQCRIAELEIEINNKEIKADDVEITELEIEIEKRSMKADDAKIDELLSEKISMETDDVGISSIDKNEAERQPSKLKLKLRLPRTAEVEANVQKPKCENKNEEMQTYKSKGRKTKRKPSVEEGEEGKRYYTRATSPKKDEEDKKKAVAARKKKKNANIPEVVEVETYVTKSNNGEEVETFPKLRNIIESCHFHYFEIEEQVSKVVNFFSFGHKFSIAYKDDDLEIQGRMVEDLMFDNFTASEVIDFNSKYLKENPA